MSEKNSVKIFMGAGFIAVALLCGATAFYFLKVKPEMERRKMEAAMAQKPASAPEPAKAQTPPGLNMEILLAESEKIYGAGERNRREGILWVDRQTPRFVVTLGALNGVAAGSTLGVYDGDRQVAEVSVDSVLDVISYVTPADKSADQFEYDYYKVVIK